MKLIAFIFVVFSLNACSGNRDNKILYKDMHDSSKTKESDSIQYILIRDNLYHDNSGNIYLKAIDRSLAENGTAEENETQIKDRWLTVVYCDTCKLTFTGENTEQNVNKQPDRMTELRNVIDTASFRLVKSGTRENVDIYKDKNHTYYYNVMVDGGTISLEENLDNTLSDNTFFKPVYFKQLQNYILKNGKTEKVNASGRIDKPIYITYHSIEINTIKLTVDKSNRIYFHDQNNLKLGNILLSEDEKSIGFEDCSENNKQLIYSTYIEILKLA